MPKRNKLSALLIFIAFSFIFCLKTANAQVIPEKFIISEDKTWTKTTPNLTFDTQVVIRNGATLTIEKGTVVTFEVNPINPFIPSGILIESGKLVVNGTREDNVVFTSPDDGFSLVFSDNNQTSFLRYTEIVNGGFIPTAEGGGGDLVPKNPVMDVRGGKIHIENSKFLNSRYTEMEISDEWAYDADWNPVYDENGNAIENKAQVEVVNSNFSYPDAINSHLNCLIYDEATDEDYVDTDCAKRVYLKNDWYNNPDGPTTDDEEMEKGYKITGFHYLNYWKNDESIFNPVVIIPGILGSAKLAGNWKLDPILHIYDNLVESFEKNGYEKNLNLFEFPYEWRNSNEITAGKLKTKIEDIVAQTKISKVDVVAHSMGGLVAREYIKGDDYDNNIDQLITLGTPHRGSPKSYLSWEGGEIGIKFDDYILEKIFLNEAKHYGKNLKDYIQYKILSINELLPDYSYLSRNGNMLDYSDAYPRNTFLEELNDQNNLEKLSAVDFTNIISETKRTISEIKIINSTVSGKWEHGMPENFYDGSTDQGLIYGDGDETVPKYSAKTVPANELIEIDSTHQKLPTKAQCEVVKKLTGKSGCVYTDEIQLSLSTLFVSVYSPIDIQVIAPSGKWVGRNIQNLPEEDQIPGAYYTGYDGVDSEFLTIPDPENGEYEIVTKGTGDDDYRIEIFKFTEDPESGEVAETSGVISGTATDGAEEEKTIIVETDAIITEAETGDTTAPEITIASPQSQNYLNRLVLPINYTVSDDTSTPENIQIEVLLDGVAVSPLQVDLSLQKLGKHLLKIAATDEAGNQNKKELEFTVVTNADAISKNITHYRKIGLITDQKTANALQIRIRLISGTLDLIAKMDKKERDRAEKALIKVLNKEINEMIELIQGKLAGTINPPAGELLAESLNYIKKY